MRVVIVGGYGVFGSLTARLLARDGHKLWLAGRRPDKGRALGEELGAATLRVDISKSAMPVFDVGPDVVIDAAGPFQNYGEDPHRLASLCIAHGCHYLDLSDSSDFTKGIAALNARAEAAQVFALSGASSVPGLSSIIVDDLMKGLDEVDHIGIAILPGNRAPRGPSVIKSIVGGVGRPAQVLRNGRWQSVAGWTDRKEYELEPGLRRAGYFVNVPDIALLPEKTGAKSVMFRAGFELPVMNQALHLLAKLRQRWQLEIPDAGYAALHLLSKALYPFGSDRGGMQVTVAGRSGNTHVARKWTLIAENGHGPFVPGVVCRAILRGHPGTLPGARPCLAELTKSSVENAMADLAIRIGCVEMPTEEGPASRGDHQGPNRPLSRQDRSLLPGA
ncbi:MAG: saccharopine dehydrogenase NADP-binding domain-containing protein [Pseudomonadota bacterium]